MDVEPGVDVALEPGADVDAEVDLEPPVDAVRDPDGPELVNGSFLDMTESARRGPTGRFT